LSDVGGRIWADGRLRPESASAVFSMPPAAARLRATADSRKGASHASRLKSMSTFLPDKLAARGLAAHSVGKNENTIELMMQRLGHQDREMQLFGLPVEGLEVGGILSQEETRARGRISWVSPADDGELSRVGVAVRIATEGKKTRAFVAGKPVQYDNRTTGRQGECGAPTEVFIVPDGDGNGYPRSLAELVNHRWFASTIYLTISVNAIQMGVELDITNTSPASDLIFNMLEYTATTIFILEMVLKLAVLKKSYFGEAANWLDGSIVITSILDIVITVVASSPGQIEQLQLFRLVRLFRLLRLVKLIRMFKEMTLILQGIFDAFRTMMWVALLLFVILYACSILCVAIIGKEKYAYPQYDEDPYIIDQLEIMRDFNNFVYFGSMGRSMYTLFCMATLAEFTEIGRPVLEKQPAMLLFFFAFAIFTTFGIMNVIIGVIVDSTMQAAKELDEKIEKLEMRVKLDRLQELRDLVFAMDTDNSHTISVTEIEEGMCSPIVRENFDRLDLPPDFTAQDIFTLLDRDGDGQITTAEFMCSMFSLINNNEFQHRCNLHVMLNLVNRNVIKCYQALCHLVPNDQFDSRDRTQSPKQHMVSEASTPAAKGEFAAISSHLDHPSPLPTENGIALLSSRMDRLERLLLQSTSSLQDTLNRVELRMISQERPDEGQVNPASRRRQGLGITRDSEVVHNSSQATIPMCSLSDLSRASPFHPQPAAANGAPIFNQVPTKAWTDACTTFGSGRDLPPRHATHASTMGDGG